MNSPATNSPKHNDMVGKMPTLKQYRDSLQQLQSVWDNLSLLGQLSGTGTDMNETRQDFSQVTNNVLDSLAEETLNKTVTAITVKAQVAVDIVIRNLFERTADIGFLSTDDNVSGFLIKYAENTLEDNDYLALKLRFEEYVKKYSVYFNIVLLDLNGNVLVQLDDENPISVIHDPLVNQAIDTDDAYVEVFRKTDLLPNQDVGLVYAYRVSTDNSKKALGVLCLCFRFKNEMEGVFSNLITRDEWALGFLLDEKGIVISSSDHYQIPLGAKLETAVDKDWILTRFAGREYIAVTRETKGYQGYMGPGWMGHAMIPLDHAFDHDVSGNVDNIDKDLLTKVMRSPLLFSQTLLEIPKQASMIQSKLNQSVWNGNIWQKRISSGLTHQANFSKMLLWEISNTGFKTQNVIENTVSDLYQTVVSVMLDSSSFFASLAVDIMDRNLYERANDCRWWTLTATFQKLLSKTNLTPQDLERITGVLRYINDLYTVYANLVVFDRYGKILAVSNPDYKDCVGTVIDAEWVARTRSLKTSQDYVVSKFEPTPLYKDDPTYIYGAAIRSEDGQFIVGGIGIVFDSTPQFAAMLEDSLPRDANGDPIDGSFTLYVDGELKVISSTLPKFKVGSQFNLQPHLCKLETNQAAFDIAIYEGKYYAIGARASSGYREFKGPDDAYQNPVTALIFIPLGNAAEIDAIIEAEYSFQHNQFKPTTTNNSSDTAEEYATFYVGSQWLGIPATQVVEAIQATKIKQLPDTSSILAGVIQHQGAVIPIINLALTLGDTSSDALEGQLIVVIQRTEDSSRFGILVNALGEIPAIEPEKIESIATIFSSANTTAEGITKVDLENGKHNLLIILSAESMWTKINAVHQEYLDNAKLKVAA
jgi:chemotaxis signal transduction protein